MLPDKAKFAATRPAVEEGILSQRGFQLALLILIFFSTLSFTGSTVPGLSVAWDRFFYYSEIAVVAIFTCEYLYRIYCNRRAPLRYMLSFYGIIDLLAVLPFFFTLTATSVSLRLLRVLRILTVLKIYRHSRALRRFAHALYSVRSELTVFLITFFVLVHLSSIGIYYFEHEAQPEVFSSVFHGLWWAIVTFSTVGYGDAYPITTGGRIFAAFVLLLGVIVVAGLIGIVTSALAVSRLQEESTGVDDDE